VTSRDEPRLRRELGLVPLIAIVFFSVSGGPYGIEDIVPSFGPGLALLLLVLTPAVWSLPVSLAMAELASAMPDEGGYVTWVRRAFGPFWSFQVGWWSWIDSFLDVAVYPALAVEYVRFWVPNLPPLARTFVVVLFVLTLTVLNVVGVRPVGRAAVALGVGALLPVVAMAAVGTTTVATAPWRPFLAEHETLGAGLGLGLAVVMWNYSGWDTPSTALGETETPERAFRRALFATLPLIAAAYILPVALTLASGTTSVSAWRTGSLPALAQAFGGRWLGHLVAAGAMIAAAGQFLSQLLTNSRLPYVLARDGQMPAALGILHARFGTPWVAVLVSSAVYTVLAALSFRELVVLNMWLYSLSLIVELAAFVWLRLHEPKLSRPWRVPGGTACAALVAAVPSALAVLAMATAGWTNTLAGLIAAATGPVAYLVLATPRASHSPSHRGG
jgi:amino acid transporter